MEVHVQRLAEIDRCLHEALADLRTQQGLTADRELPEEAYLVLLSNSLRSFARLEDERQSIIRELGDYLPVTPRAVKGAV